MKTSSTPKLSVPAIQIGSAEPYSAKRGPFPDDTPASFACTAKPVMISPLMIRLLVESRVTPDTGANPVAIVGSTVAVTPVVALTSLIAAAFAMALDVDEAPTSWPFKLRSPAAAVNELTPVPETIASGRIVAIGVVPAIPCTAST